MAVEGASPTCQSCRESVKTPKALEQDKRRLLGKPTESNLYRIPSQRGEETWTRMKTLKARWRVQAR